MHRFTFTLLIIIMGVATAVFAEGNPIAGVTKSAVCMSCHGVDGNIPVPKAPKIAGLPYGYLLQQMLDFQKGEKGPRYDATMYTLLKDLSKQDLEDLAAYYATQTMTIGSAAKDKVALGQSLYRGGNIEKSIPACAACHGATGGGNYLALFPRLGGQDSNYVVTQLTKFKDKQRTNDPNSIMQDIAGRLNDEEIEAVASYVEGLH